MRFKRWDLKSTDFPALSEGCWIFMEPKTVCDSKKKEYKDLFVFCVFFFFFIGKQVQVCTHAQCV